MKRTTLFYAAILIAAVAGNAHAVFKCTTAKGVVYQDRPCREGNETDVPIVVPTGEVFKKPAASPDDAAPAGAAPAETRSNAPRAGRTSADEPAPVAKYSGKRNGERNGEAGAPPADGTPKKDTQANAGAATTSEPARNAEPSAKYYTNDGFGSGTDTPGRLTCESSTGEKRVFYLSDGKLMSI